MAAQRETATSHPAGNECLDAVVTPSGVASSCSVRHKTPAAKSAPQVGQHKPAAPPPSLPPVAEHTRLSSSYPSCSLWLAGPLAALSGATTHDARSSGKHDARSSGPSVSPGVPLLAWHFVRGTDLSACLSCRAGTCIRGFHVDISTAVCVRGKTTLTDAAGAMKAIADLCQATCGGTLLMQAKAEVDYLHLGCVSMQHRIRSCLQHWEPPASQSTKFWIDLPPFC